MEEALKDLAGQWSGKGSAETFDEFKDGIGNQLNKEDSETHYNLGIAYMEMELFSEASKEFKIALKDARLELDCYTRLGLCAMAENNPEEAAAYYSRGLKAEDRSDDEKKALMYELALAHEASGSDDEALELFREIFAMDPDFREAASKVNSLAFTRPMVPLDDGYIEVELL
jgi:tetratricopeptide (TPR) repeat protein